MPTSTEQPRVTDFPARGQVKRIDGRTVVFQPANTNYELHLTASGGTDGIATGVTVSAVIRVTARKVWTVPSGGNFLDPIYGSPRKVQGRVKYLSDTEMVVQAGTPIIVTLPRDAEGLDLVRGPLTLGGLVNAATVSGATIEFLK